MKPKSKSTKPVNEPPAKTLKEMIAEQRTAAPKPEAEEAAANVLPICADNAEALTGPPYDADACETCAEFTGYDETVERLDYDPNTRTFYVVSNREETRSVTLSRALYWFQTRFFLDEAAGNFNWYRRELNELLWRAHAELKSAEEKDAVPAAKGQVAA